MDIKKMSNRDLKYGIDRCNARLAGIMQWDTWTRNDAFRRWSNIGRNCIIEE